jgi:hypothetical protein
VPTGEPKLTGSAEQVYRQVKGGAELEELPSPEVGPEQAVIPIDQGNEQIGTDSGKIDGQNLSDASSAWRTIVRTGIVIEWFSVNALVLGSSAGCRITVEPVARVVSTVVTIAHLGGSVTLLGLFIFGFIRVPLYRCRTVAKHASDPRDQGIEGDSRIPHCSGNRRNSGKKQRRSPRVL